MTRPRPLLLPHSPFANFQYKTLLSVKECIISVKECLCVCPHPKSISSSTLSWVTPLRTGSCLYLKLGQHCQTSFTCLINASPTPFLECGNDRFCSVNYFLISKDLSNCNWDSKVFKTDFIKWCWRWLDIRPIDSVYHLGKFPEIWQ